VVVGGGRGMGGVVVCGSVGGSVSWRRGLQRGRMCHSRLCCRPRRLHGRHPWLGVWKCVGRCCLGLYVVAGGACSVAVGPAAGADVPFPSVTLGLPAASVGTPGVAYWDGCGRRWEARSPVRVSLLGRAGGGLWGRVCV
jgi:hypothetical protein